MWGVYENRADHRYYDCMYDFATDTYCNGTEPKDFSVRYSAVLCEEKITEFVPISIYEPNKPVIMDVQYIGICWNRSRSLWVQLFP